MISGKKDGSFGRETDTYEADIVGVESMRQAFTWPLDSIV
jgi:hypothetical protein